MFANPLVQELVPAWEPLLVGGGVESVAAMNREENDDDAVTCKKLEMA